jgi:hypothetical protein
MEGTQNVLSEGNAASFTAGRSVRVVRHVVCHLGQLRLPTASAQVGLLEAALRRQQLASYFLLSRSETGRFSVANVSPSTQGVDVSILRHSFLQKSGVCCDTDGGRAIAVPNGVEASPWAAELTMVSRTGDQTKHSEKGESHESSKLLSLTTFGCGSRRWYSNWGGRSR